MAENVYVTCGQAKEIDLVLYLSSLGYEPSKIRANQYWYRSPLRNEKTPSFKVNRSLNKWYDFGDGVGGSIIDFGIRYFHCSIAEFLNSYLAGNQIPIYNPDRSIKDIPVAPVLIVNQVKPLSAISLIRYLGTRKIEFEIGRQYLKEVHYTNTDRQFYGLGFENSLGGWEIRSAVFKGSASPKYVTHLNNGSDIIHAFEGFMDFLSFLQLHYGIRESHSSDFLILNGVSMVNHAVPILQPYPKVYLHLDNNSAGNNATQFIQSEVLQAEDMRTEFKGYVDLNEFLCMSEIPDIKPP